jgi:glycosyltransferase involved in cell wall biosynthesis
MSELPRRRIAFVGVDPGARGGIAQFGANLITAVGDRAETRAWSYRRLYPALVTAGRQPPDPSAPGAAIASRSGLVAWNPRSWRRAGAEIERFAPDLMVVQWWSPLFAACVVALARRARRGGTIVLLVCHNARPHERFPLWRRLTRVVLGRADTVVALSEVVATDLRELSDGVAPRVLAHPPNLAVAGDGCDAAGWRERLEAGDRPIVLCFGNVRAYKGVEDLIEAAALMPRDRGALVVVAGECFLPVDRLRDQIARRDLGSVVRLWPDYVPSEDAPGLFAAADVVALPYREASQSGVLSQARAARRPVVVTDVGGLPGASGDEAVVVAARDPEALAQGLLAALEHGRAGAPPDVGWDHWADLLIEEAGQRLAMSKRTAPAAPLERAA